MTSQSIDISNNGYWFKIVGMLQQNRAIIESSEKEAGCTIHFMNDRAGVFDQIRVENLNEAERQLRINGLTKFEEDAEAKKFIVPPPPPFHRSSHPKGPISSSGRYLKSR